MENALRRLFSDTIIQEEKKSEMKEEPAFKATGISEDEDSAFYGGKPKKFKTSFNKSTFGSKPEKRENNETNPRDSNGNFLTCRNCGSRFHFARHCPENQKETREQPPI